MAATALSLRFRRVQSPRSFSRLFSSDSPITTNDDAAANPNTNTAASPPPPPNSFKSYFSDVKSSLNQQQQQQQQSPFKSSFSLSDNRKPIQSLEEIGRTLSGFRRRTTPNAAGINTPAPPPSSSNFPGQISLQKLYNKSMGSLNSLSESGRDPNNFDAIRQSLTQLHNNNAGGGGGPKPKMMNSFLGRGNVGGPPVYGGSDLLPAAALGKDREMRSVGKSTEFLTTSTPDELGRMLSKLRPEEAKNKFSLAELSERLSKLRQMEEEEEKKVAIGQTAVYTNIRKSLQTIKMSEEDKTKKTPAHKLDFLSQFGLTQDFMSSPPKKHLVEKYFHPDNMSSAEKLKIELKKVREEFKMSESDCGSARVQVAQLTTKIKHLSTVLHKKDKHSRKGLTAMVTQRKKLLKYLRRTDWDSYCLVLSKLGLRDNPDYKN